jgi:hypothetical protein
MRGGAGEGSALTPTCVDVSFRAVADSPTRCACVGTHLSFDGPITRSLICGLAPWEEHIPPAEETAFSVISSPLCLDSCLSLSVSTSPALYLSASVSVHFSIYLMIADQQQSCRLLPLLLGPWPHLLTNTLLQVTSHPSLVQLQMEPREVKGQDLQVRQRK